MATNIIPIPASGEPAVAGIASEPSGREPTAELSAGQVEVSFDAILQQLTEATPLVESQSAESIELPAETIEPEIEVEADGIVADAESAVNHHDFAPSLSPERIDAFLSLGQPIEFEAESENVATAELPDGAEPVATIHPDDPIQPTNPATVFDENAAVTPIVAQRSGETTVPIREHDDAAKTQPTEPTDADAEIPIVEQSHTSPTQLTDKAPSLESPAPAHHAQKAPIQPVDVDIDGEVQPRKTTESDGADATAEIDIQAPTDPAAGAKLATTPDAGAQVSSAIPAPPTVRKPSARTAEPASGPEIPEPESPIPTESRAELRPETTPITLGESPNQTTEASFTGDVVSQAIVPEHAGSDQPSSPLPSVPTETRLEPTAPPANRTSFDATTFSVDARPEATTVRGETVFRSLPGGMGEQVVAAVHQTLNSPEGSTEKAIFLELQPPELGRLRIRVEQGADSIATHIVASEASSGDLLSSRRDSLQDALSDLGFGEASVDISSSEDGQFFDDREFDQRQNNGSTHSYSRESERPEPIESRESDSGLNIIA